MPVSGKEERGVLSRQSSTDISPCVPLKKRRSLFVSPPSPPHQEVLPELNDLKKDEESSSGTTNEVKLGTDSTEKKDSSLELKKNEAPPSADVKHKQESSLEDGSRNDDSAPELGSKEELGSSLQDNNLASGLDLKKTDMSTLNHGPSGINVANESPENSDVSKINLLQVKKEGACAPNANLGCSDLDVSRVKYPELSPIVNLDSANRVKCKTDLLLTGKLANSGVPGKSPSAALSCVKKETHSKLVDEDVKLKLSMGLESNGKLALGPKELLIPSLNVDPSLFALSLGKGKHVMGEMSGDTGLSNASESECANRSNWDLNTTMDSWEGSMCDAVLHGSIGRSGKTISLIDGRLLSSNSLINVRKLKEKQVVATNEPRSSSPNSSVLLNKQAEDSFRLTLGSSFGEMDFAREHSGLSAEVAPRMDGSTNLRCGLHSIEDKKSPGAMVVKSEPSDENSKNSSVETLSSSAELSDFNVMKREPKQRHVEAVKLLASHQDITGEMSIKSEPISEVSQHFYGTRDLRRQNSISKFVHCEESDSSSSVLPLPLTPQKPSPSRLAVSSELSIGADVSNQSENSIHTKEPHMVGDVFLQAAKDMISRTAHHKVRKENMADHEMGNSEVVDMDVDDPELKGTMETVHDLPRHGDASVSDEEKVNISAECMEEESDGSECESDHNQVFGSHLQGRVGKDDDDYEDGEVREPLENSKREELSADGGADIVKHGGFANQHCPSGLSKGDANTEPSCVVDTENELNIRDITAVGCIKQTVGRVSNKNCQQLIDRDGYSDEFLLDGTATTACDEDPYISAHGKLLVRTGNESSQEIVEKGASFDGTNSSSNRIVPTVGEVKSEIAEAVAVNMDEKPDSSLTKIDSSVNGNSTAKDSISAGNKSRIINLARASATSPSKTRSIPDRLLSSRNGRGRYSDFDEEKFFPRGKRDEMDIDGLHRSFRERIQDQSFRNSRSNYTRGRGRFSGRLDTSRSEWGSNRDFAFGSCNDDYRFTRNKHVTAPADTELDCNEYVIRPDGASFSCGRGRKSINDDLTSFRRPSSRRLSPGCRNGPDGREYQMVRRIPRNISPGRRNDNNAVDLAGLRQDEKYVRGLPDDIAEPAYAHRNSMYEGNTRFVRGNRNFSAFQGRGFPRFQLKSPVGSRARSPGPWSSPRRRSPGGFDELPQLAQHRPPAMYRVERMRSPDRSCFSEDMAARRRGSPSFLARPSDEVGDVDSGREHGHPRPINISRTSPPGRVFSRSTRRLDIMDPRIRTGDNEYFGRPVPSGRFREFHGERSSEERRKDGESRGFIRSFRPPFNSDGDNPQFHLDDGPRPFRFCSEGDTDFVGRGVREREFDGRMKSRPMPPPRRMQSIDDQEGNYREDGQVWHEDGFNGGSRFKRRRF